MRKRAESKFRVVICRICQALFQSSHSQAKYCSPEHQRQGERASWRKYGAANSQSRNAYSRSHYASNVESISQRIKRYQSSEAGKLAREISDARQKAKFPEKYNARQSVLIAKRNGALVPQPCEACGAPKTQAHHSDYSKPLDVRWLCGACHRKEHSTGKVGIVMVDGEVAVVNEENAA